MNVTEMISTTQSQASGPTSKTETSQGSGIFQALLANGLKQQDSEQQSSGQLQDLISLLNSAEAAALLALLGLNPQAENVAAPVQIALGNQMTGAGLPAMPALQTVGLQQNLMLLGKGTQIMPGSLAVANNSDSAGSTKGHLFEILSGLLQQAGISMEEAVRQVKEAMKDGNSLAEAVRQMTENTQQQSSHRLLAGTASFSVLQAGHDGLHNPKQMGSQLRPEMLEGLLSAGTQYVGSAETAESLNETAPNQAVGEQSAVPVSGLAAGLPLAKSQVIEGQPTAVHTKLSDSQFESDFPEMLVKQAALIERGGRAEMRVTLMPEGLGEIQVRIQGEGGIVSLHIAADTQHARSLLDANLSMLKQQLESQGMQVNRVEVVASNSSAGLNMDQGMLDGRGRQGQDANPQQPNKQQAAKSGTQFDDEILYQQDAGIAGQYDWIA